MKITGMCAIFITLFLSLFNVIDAQVEKKNRLTSIVQSIDQYKGKSVLMIMKLRDVDYVMEKITFYDSDNIDIVFDIAGYVKKPALKKSMRTDRFICVFLIMLNEFPGNQLSDKSIFISYMRKSK